jgi:hypothetical protein
MGPPLERDIIMGPPPVPPPGHPYPQKDKSDINEKYRKLKRRYFELEEVSLFSLRIYASALWVDFFWW